jgi:mono/diheme cytochrome c family protein
MTRKGLRVGLFLACITALAVLAGCSTRLPGKPSEAERWRAPADVTDFDQLFAQNCAGCHGAGGTLGAARSLNDPLYQAFVPDDALRQVIAQGRPGTNMPAFSPHAGGSLTDQQIELLVSGMRARWAKPDDFKGVEIPPYSVGASPASSPAPAATPSGSSASAAPANPVLPGAAVFQTNCARCHGANGTGGSAGSIVDPNFLNLVSDQGLRTTVVVGRADLSKPDWRSDVHGRPMSPQEIDAVVAWIVAQRQAASPVTALTDGGKPPAVQK